MKPKIIQPLFAVIMLFAVAANAGCKIDIADYVGWEIIYAGTVTGYIDDAGNETDGFEGCQHGRVLIVDDYKQITCADYGYGYGYGYAYRPDIVIMSNGYAMKACINDEVYDIRYNVYDIR